jgi:hypothetical protein
VRTLRSLIVVASTAALAFTAAPARAADESPFKFEFHGFVTYSGYYQDQVFNNGQGQGLLLVAPNPANNAPYKGNTVPPPAGAATKSASLWSGDIRQTRFAFAMTGPKALGATPKGYIEADFFGGSAPGAFVESWIPRMRAAYAELNWGNTILQAGQFGAHLLLGQLPASAAHIANPYSYGAGTVGWRTIGLRILHTIPLDGVKLELAFETAQPRWLDAPSASGIPGNTPATVGYGPSSGFPQLVGRVKGSGKAGSFDWSVYVAGSYDSISLKGGFGDATTPNGVTLTDGSVVTKISPYVAEVGGTFKFDPVTLAFNVYTGTGTAPMIGSFAQAGDIADTGYWVQAGWNITKEFSIWGFYGGETLDKTDVGLWVPATAAGAPKSDNTTIGGMLRYQDGGYAFAAEFYNLATKYLAVPGAAGWNEQTTKGSQLILTAGYFW